MTSPVGPRSPAGPRSPGGQDRTARPRLTVLGSLSMDLIVRTEHLPMPGETRLGNGFATSQGGKGANQAIAAARAGAKVTMIGAVGTDSFGSDIAAALAADGVHVDRLRRLPGPTGIAVITVDDAAENTIVVAPGANGQLTGLTDDDTAAITGADLLLLQLEVPIEIVVAAAKAAAAVGVPVLMNPSPARALAAELLATVTILVLNEGEAAAIGASALEQVPHLVVTLGPLGARYRGPDGAVVSARPPVVAPVDTTGAGDAFTGAFAVAWLEGADPAAALAFGCAAGALATTRRGAAAPTRRDIDLLLAATDG